MNQTPYIHKMLDRFRMQDCNPADTPLTVKNNLSKAQCPKNDNERKTDLEYSGDVNYLELVGSLLLPTKHDPTSSSLSPWSPNSVATPENHTWRLKKEFSGI